MNRRELAALRAVVGTVFAIDQTATHDGPGLRMTVYFKGCPLRCVWCHSPESQNPEREIVWYETRCLHCGACVEVCPAEYRTLDPIRLEVHGECLLCERCTQACPAGAVEIKGSVMTAGEVVKQAVRQRRFFERSGGGVTLTGGEPTLQPEFAEAVLTLLKSEGIHTAIETSGLANGTTYDRLRPLVDLFLYDLKHADDALHRRDTGVSNQRILDNLERLVAAGAEVLVRVPCIPTRNGTPEIIAAIARAARERGVTRVELQPYNPATPGKYAWLQKEYALADLKPQSSAEMAVLEEAARAEGVSVVGR